MECRHGPRRRRSDTREVRQGNQGREKGWGKEGLSLGSLLARKGAGERGDVDRDFTARGLHRVVHMVRMLW